VVCDADGRLELFKVSPDGTLRYCWQKQPGGNWSGWSGLGGSWLPGLAAATNAHREIMVFAVDRADHALSCIQQKRQTRDWSGWTVLGGPVVPPATVGQNTDGRLEVCATDTNGVVRHIFQTEPGKGWSAWEDFGGRLCPGLLYIRRPNGALELFGVDAASSHLLHRWQKEAGASRAWLPWASLGGSIEPGIAAARATDGRLQVFAVGSTNSMVYRLCQESAEENGRWLPWENFSLQVHSADLFQDGLAVAQNADGRIQVFGVKKDGAELLTTFQNKLEHGAWTTWSSTTWSSVIKSSLCPPVVLGRNQDGSLELFGVGSSAEGTVYHTRQINANSAWVYWSSMDRHALQYLPRPWQTDEGLPNNRVQALAQTADGYLWVGTHEGLARFDGLEFTTFDGPNTREIKGASISALCAARDGSLRIGTEHGALVEWRSGQFSVLPGANGLGGHSIHAIYVARDGATWVGSARGLDRLQNGGLQTYTVDQGLLANDVTAIYEDGVTNLWIGTTKGMNYLYQGQMEAFPLIDGVPNDPVRSLCRDRAERLWIGCDHGLVWSHRISLGRNSPVPITADQSVFTYGLARFYARPGTDGLADNRVSAILEDSQDNLWVGTYSGLSRFASGHFRTELTRSGIAYDQINVFLEDRWGDVWVGSREGLVRLALKACSVYTRQQGLSHNHVTSVLEDHLGRLWAGTWGGGLDEISEDRVQVHAATNRLPSNLILALCEDRNGGIWVGADGGGGLSYLNDQTVIRYTRQNGLPDEAVTALHQDRAGELWVGTSGGLCRLTEGQVVRESQCGTQRVRAICEDSESVLWFGGEAGLTRRLGGRFENLSVAGMFPRETVSALYADDDRKTLWAGTTEGGLLRWRDNRFDRYTVQQGLLSNEILGIVEDHGWLWMASTKGIFRVRKHDLESPGTVMPCIVYGVADGLESIVCGGMATPSVWKTADDRLCFATTKGLAIIDNRNAPRELSPPLVQVEQFDLDRKPIPLPVFGDLIVPPSDGELEFGYTALDLRAAEKCRFKYKLDGVDPNWIDAGTRRVAHYSKVSPGRYCFHVIACNKDGVWNQAGVSIPLLLRPHVWQTWWFQGLAAAALAGAGGAIVRFVLRQKVRQKLALLQMQHSLEKERARISRDIHDDLGATLTQITLLSELAQRAADQPPKVSLYTAQISQTARDLVQTMDEIVWAVNPRNDSLPRVTGYIFQYAEKFFAGTPLHCRFDSPEEWPDQSLSAETRHHLFLAAKEAMNNVARHSGATEVWVRWKLIDGVLQLCIEDNGKGFAAGPRGQFGNGLANMKKRMEEIGGEFELTSIPGAGTNIGFKLRLRG
jgi:ligand-binding sensor domain-containing protein/signal transduction histidine kinase